MGQSACCIKNNDDENLNKQKKKNLNPQSKEKNDASDLMKNKHAKQSLSQSYDCNIPVYERISEIETKEAPTASKTQNIKSQKKNSPYNYTAHYSSEGNIPDMQIDSQENYKDQLIEDPNNSPATAALGQTTPRNYRRDIQGNQNFKTLNPERVLDLSNNANNHPNSYNNQTFQHNQLSQSNISDPTATQNYNVAKPKSPYTIKMEEFQRVNLKNINNHYLNLKNSVSKSKQSQQKRLSDAQHQNLQKRIERELASIVKSIECDEEKGGVFFAYDESNLQYIKILITGAANTPFAYGIYVFDMFIPDDYPINPPKLNFQSTSKGTIRFSPLLPTDGRVCLSLLNIHNGQQLIESEQWSEYTSNLTQVIQTIQNDILNSDLYYQEPTTNYNPNKNNNDSSLNVSDMYNQGYQNVVRYANIVHAMEESIKQTDGNFKEFSKLIQTHFSLLQSQIIAQINKWINEQQNINEEDIKPLYTGIVSQHNPEIAKSLQNNGFSKQAQNQLKNLQQQFKKLNSTFKEGKQSVLS
ncbi:ubiquitin-conjugating enzyme (macronuclear) [Tetrahymena thermophila SB210]|uniref:Ubiquitin-conjugating enzyme n=1 Tax=Tetrahymena thermophila (strain SB210) TaxID=312017 RepID=Q22GD8_TETTS|nr:ubiquitin-conjugating enzyme [Tetrahymena thermophila SB210]EAR84393.1 ubiquitin-conjugating enzyme [Tetrahymena thermophila SB210]|eukprot:XP_001032056.1 ubiquitin-conjugating enzyme [Tetrahymena thermophila SB210]